MNVNIFGGDYSHHTNTDAGAADNDVLYTSADVSKKNYHVFHNKDTVAIDVHASLDGTNFTSVYTQDTQASNTNITQATVPAGEIGVLRGKFRKIRVDQAAAGAIEAGNVIVPEIFVVHHLRGDEHAGLLDLRLGEGVDEIELLIDRLGRPAA